MIGSVLIRRLSYVVSNSYNHLLSRKLKNYFFFHYSYFLSSVPGSLGGSLRCSLGTTTFTIYEGRTKNTTTPYIGSKSRGSGRC